MEATYVIKRPLITEKSTVESDESNRYSFEVAASARKEEVKRAVEQLYKVRVAKVRTQTRKGKQLRTRYGYVQKPNWKKAVVELHEEDRIELF